MHDPKCVAFDIYLGSKVKKNGHYRSPFITIWHVDPEKDGTDDSCGWFIRRRHLPKEVFEKVRREFEFNFKHNYWFNEAGYPVFSVMGTTLEMYSKAAWIIFMWLNGDQPTDKASRQYRRFMNKHLFNILHFAENPTDSLHSGIVMKYGVGPKEGRIENFASTITSDIFRKMRKWWQHPRWHIHHWEIQFHPIQRLKRRYWDKCCICGKRGFKGSAMSDWYGTRIWHEACDESRKAPIKPEIKISQ